MSLPDAENVRNIAAKLTEISSKRQSISFSMGLSDDKKRFEINSISLFADSRAVFAIDIKEGEVSSVRSDILSSDEIGKYHQVMSHSIIPGAMMFDCIDARRSSQNMTAALLMSLLQDAADVSEKSIVESKFVNIGPIRHLFDRYIYPASYDHKSTSMSISELADALSDARVRAVCDKWFEIFGIRFEINDINDVLRELIAVQKSTDLTLSIADVGFGYSQVLPIVIECASAPASSTIVIEQPEVHLHPRMQSELADFFIDIAAIKANGDPKRRFVIETHSEALINRLRRRMVEGTLEPTDVAVYYVEGPDGEGMSTMRRVKIHESGHIEWPQDFYSNDLEDTRTFFMEMARGAISKDKKQA